MRRPARQGEARAAAKAILRGLKTRARNWPVRLGNSQIGIAIRCPLQNGGPWSAVGTVDGRVVAAAERLRDDGVLVDIETGDECRLPIPMKTIGEVMNVGPTHHLIGHREGNAEIGAYEMSRRTATSPPQDEMSLWSVDGRRQRRMLLTATHNAVQTGTDEQKTNVDAKKAHLFYQRGFRFTASAVLAAATISKIHGGSSWTALIGKSRTIERAMALWFNSTLGMILHWHAGGRQQVGRVRIQVSGIKQIPVPDLGTLGAETLKAAAAAHLRLRETALADAMHADSDRARDQIDAAICGAMGWGAPGLAAVRALRRAWVQEPSVRGNKRSAGSAAGHGSITESVDRALEAPQGELFPGGHAGTQHAPEAAR